MKYILVLLLLIQVTFLSAQSIERVEPPNWWVDMTHNELQILVYGKDISTLTPVVQSDKMKLKKTVSVENPNYLFLYVEVPAGSRAGKVPIQFFRKDSLILEYVYGLLDRPIDPSTIKGFDTSDVLYLITPDRFVNGNPKNDEIPDMKEKGNRKSKNGRHGGDIQGIYNHLDYIADMGYTAIWLNPVLENDMPKYSYHGYAATDFYRVDRRFGTNEEYRDFCNKAKEKGLKIIMDMILNHCGSEHWFVLDPPTIDWLNLQGDFKVTSHKRTTVQDIHASEYDKSAFSDGWFVKTMPDLNQRNPLMADYLIYNTLWWIEYSGISGIRMDTYPYPDKDFMGRWTCEVMEEYPAFNIVGEEWTTNPAIVSYWQKDKVNHDNYVSCLPSLMDFPVQDALVNSLKEKENWNTGWVKVYEMMANDFLYAHPEDLVVFPDNHDMARFYTQINNDFELFKMGMIYFSTIRGVPQFYYGTEILMDSDKSPDDHGIIRSDFPGGWSGDKVNAFSGTGLSKKQKNAQNFTRELLNWRKSNTVVHSGKLVQFAPENGIYSYFRQSEQGKVMVVFNKNTSDTKLDLAKYNEILHGHSQAYDVLNDQLIDLENSLNVAKRSALILEIR